MSIDQAILNNDLELIHSLKEASKQPCFKSNDLKPCLEAPSNGNPDLIELGRERTRAGKVGCILLAGGQGSRLNHVGPKGTFPTTVIHKKSLFQIVAEKVQAASQLCGCELSLAIMTSPSNDRATKEFFSKHKNFGLQQTQLDFFTQSTLPIVDSNFSPIYDSNKKVIYGPDGNGSVYKSFCQSPIAEKWQKKGILYVHFILIDNPLADPFDFEMIGKLSQDKDEIVVKSCRRQNPQEKVGVLAHIKEKLSVIEYSELPKNLVFEKEPLACLSLHAMTLEFVKQVSHKKLPMHKAKKKYTYFDFEQQKEIIPKSENAWKFETFIFDAFCFSDRISIIEYPREDTFAPLKDDIHGPNNIQNVQKALLNYERKLFKKVVHLSPPQAPFELSSQFYYPTKELFAKWPQYISQKE